MSLPETRTVTIRFSEKDYKELLHTANQGDYKIANVLRVYINLGRKALNKPPLDIIGYAGRPKGARNKK